ncbi:MAG: sigma factor, partial [Pseudomonadota bacterium]
MDASREGDGGDGWPTEAHARASRVAERTAREAYGKLLARLSRRTGNIEAAEDALSQAFAKALSVWPRKGIPDAPEAWLSTVALNAFRDTARRVTHSADKAATLKILAEEQAE